MGGGADLGHQETDLADPEAPARLVGAAVQRFGPLDTLVVNHAGSSVGRLNCVNPGPTDTGWATPELTASVGRQLPRGRWNSPEEAAAVVAMLLSADAGTITGQVVNAEGGFRRWQL